MPKLIELPLVIKREQIQVARITPEKRAKKFCVAEPLDEIKKLLNILPIKYIAKREMSNTDK